MAQRFTHNHRPPKEALEKIISLFHRLSMALYLGTIALEVHWSLERTQQMVDLLVDEHVLRQLTEDEKRQMMFPSGANMYVLIERASPSKARM